MEGGIWKEAHRLYSIQQDWKGGVQWLGKHSKNQRAGSEACPYQEVDRLLGLLQWGEQTDIPGADRGTSIADFAAYLSENKMMNTDCINMMFAHLSGLAQEDLNTDSFFVIEQLRFIYAVEKFSNKISQNTRFLRRLEERLRKGEVQAVIFPVHMQQEGHWVTTEVDFETREIAYGTSIFSAGPVHVLMEASLKVIRLCIKGCQRRGRHSNASRNG